MLTELEQSLLKRKAIEAWEKFHNYQYEVIEPHFYKEKKGRKMELINPWKNLEERKTAEAKSNTLYWTFHELRVEYWRETGESIPISVLWKKQETKNGDRFVKIEQNRT